MFGSKFISEQIERLAPKSPSKPEVITLTFVRTTSGRVGFINEVYWNEEGQQAWYSLVPVQNQCGTYVPRYDRKFGAWAGGPAKGGEITHEWPFEWVNDGAAV